MHFLLVIVNTLIGAIVFVAPSDGRTLGRCELASELLRHKMPRQQLANWLCIIEHESNRKTDAINKWNSDGSSDHGLFQINDRYWCSPGGANVCKMHCSQLRDNYIGDDCACAKTIFGVHGYSAWVAWSRHCKNRNLDHYLHGCYIPLKRS